MGRLLIKRVYEPAGEADGFRVLVDRLWPRGMTKEKARVDQWMKAVAPSDDLRKWFHHEVSNWEEFTGKYILELKHNAAVKDLAELVENKKTVTLLYGAHDEDHNQAVVLKNFIEALPKN